MIRRILRSLYANGVDTWQGPTGTVDWDAHHATALEVARQGIVLLKNDGALPIADTVKSVVVIGGYAQHGVVSGDGSSQVRPRAGYAAQIPMRFHPLLGPTTMRMIPSAPLVELKQSVGKGVT